MPEQPITPRTKGAHCLGCRGYRLHTVHTRRDPLGKVIRELLCSVCGTSCRVGIWCAQCGDSRFKTVWTRHRSNGTVRAKKCVGCGYRIRTREVVESGVV